MYESSEGVLRGFCATCGASLTYGRDPAFEAVEPALYVAAATLDDPNAYPPTEVVWYDSRPSWFALSGNIPLHETISPENAARAYHGRGLPSDVPNMCCIHRGASLLPLGMLLTRPGWKGFNADILFTLHCDAG